MWYCAIKSIVGRGGTCSPEHSANRCVWYLVCFIDWKVRQGRNGIHQITLGDSETAPERQSLRWEPGFVVSPSHANQLHFFSGSPTQRNRVEHQWRYSQRCRGEPVDPENLSIPLRSNCSDVKTQSSVVEEKRKAEILAVSRYNKLTEAYTAIVNDSTGSPSKEEIQASYSVCSAAFDTLSQQRETNQATFHTICDNYCVN